MKLGIRGSSVRTYTQSVGLLLCALVALCGSSGAREPLGPLPLRNYQPVQQIFLNLPFERARVLERGRVRLFGESAQSNVVATDGGPIDAVLKFEQNRSTFGAMVGVGWAVQCGAEIPFGSRFGGFLDPVIDSVEELFGAFNPERKMFPNNSFGGFQVRRREQSLFHGPSQTWELMDVHARCQWQLWQREAGPVVALRGGLKLPTGRSSAVWGSGTTDLAVGAAADVPLLGHRLWGYGNLSVVQPLGRVTAAALSLDPMLQQAVGFEYLLPWSWSFYLQQELYTSPFHGLHSVVLEGTGIELAAGLGWQGAHWVVQLAGVDNVSGVAQTADFTLFLRVFAELDGAPRRPVP